MSRVKVIKLSSDDPGPYTKTMKHTVMCCGNIEGNNNKFYSIEIQLNPSSGQYRLFTHYGRINNTNVYDMRGPFFSQSDAEHEFNSIVTKKLRGKNIKEADGTSRREKYELVELASPTVGSPNVRGKTTTQLKTTVSADAIVKEASRFDQDVQRLIEQFAQENIHKITGATSLTLTSNGFETALGPVTQSTVDRARDALDVLKGLMDAKGQIDPDVALTRESNNKYLSLIPHDFGRKITEDDWIISDVKLVQEYDLLDQLEASVQMGITTNTNATKQFSNFDTELEPIDKKTKFYKELVDTVEKTKKHSHLSRWKVKNAYSVKIDKERSRYLKAEKNFGNVQEYFHGSQNANLLSILIGGLIIPPVSAGHVTGRMFGNGIYGASASTKSLNYSVGGWSGKRNRYPNTFLFRCKFAMGKTYETGHSQPSGPPAGYDSITALSDKGSLMNDEFIVYTLEQCTITHLLELEE